MSGYDEASPEVRQWVDDLQRDIREVVQMMGETYSVIDGEEMAWPKGSVAEIAFEAGVEAGSAAAMAVLTRRGWLVIPPGNTRGGEPS